MHFQGIPTLDPQGPFPPGTTRSFEEDTTTYRVKTSTKAFPHGTDVFTAADWCWSMYMLEVHHCALAEKVARLLAKEDPT